jgi:hypothetical protein
MLKIHDAGPCEPDGLKPFIVNCLLGRSRPWPARQVEYPVFLGALSHVPPEEIERPDWLAGDAVLIAPVSGPVPCEQGILQGISSKVAF